MKASVLTFFLIFSSLLYPREQSASITVVVGAKASGDGSVLVAHNQGGAGITGVHAFKILPKDSLHSGILIHTRGTAPIPVLCIMGSPGTRFQSFFNERGVTVVSHPVKTRETETESTGLDEIIARILAERSENARQAVRTAGELVGAIGIGGSGKILLIADPEEAWIMNILHGKRWAARRVPDDQAAVIVDLFSISSLQGPGKNHILSSMGVSEYATKKGWAKNDEQGVFSFAASFTRPEEMKNPIHFHRLWRAVDLLSNLPVDPENLPPFSFKPDHKIRLNDLFNLLRDHYEDTPLDSSRRYREGTPHDNPILPICHEGNIYSFVAQVRNDPPTELSKIIWLALRHPDTSAYSPWYFSMLVPPSEYMPAGEEIKAHAPYGEFSKLAELVGRQYRERIERVRKVWKNFENFAIRDLRIREKEFSYYIRNHHELALKLMTNYCHSLEYRKWLLASDLNREFRK